MLLCNLSASFPAAGLISMSLSFASSEPAIVWFFKPSSGPSSDPVPSPMFEGILSYLSRTFCYNSCLL
jgi:hypothetical protein